MSAPTFSTEEPAVRQESSMSVGGSGLRGSLRDRRKSPGAALGLDMGTITRSSRDDASHTSEMAIFRGWAPTRVSPPGGVQALLDPMQQNPKALRVMAYNILAARYTSTDKYVHCPVFALAESYRLNNILREIRGADPDIVVLEECSTAALQNPEFGGALAAQGYAWYHVPITTDKKERMSSNSQGSGAWQPSEQPDHEGVAIVYRTARFESVEQYPLRYNVLAQRDTALHPEDKRRVMVNSHNVAAIAVLRDLVSGQHLIVAGIHCFWDSAKPECQVYQVVRLLEQIERMKEIYDDLGDTSVFFCGDLNCDFRNAAVQYIVSGNNMNPAGGNMRHFDTLAEATHSLEFDTAYRDYAAENADHVTAVGGGYAGIIDYVFFQPQSFRCVAVAKLAPVADIPNTSVPSDHYPVCAWFMPTE